MATPAPELQTRQRRITVEEYHPMIEAGILDEDEHVQLIEGSLVAVTPQGIPHARVIERLNRLLVRADEARAPDHHPRTALLVIEVAGDSLRLDRGPKAALYARAGIPEYWIVNLEESAVEARREPDAAAGTYRKTTAVPSGHTVAAASVPGLAVDVASLFR